MKVIFENNKPNADYSNWLCPICESRPPAQSFKENNKKEKLCIYCNTVLDFVKP